MKVSFSYLAAHQPQLAADVLDTVRGPGAEPRLHFYAGLVHERVHDYQKAADAFEAVPRGLGDVSFEARLHRGICLSQLGQHKAALEMLRKVQEEKPDLSGLEPAISRTLERAGQLKEAEATLVRAAGRSGEHGGARGAGRLLRAPQPPPGRGVAAQRRAGPRPRDPALLFALASVHEKQGEWRLAVEKMRLVLEGDPRNAAALNFLGYTLAQNGADLDEAERLVRKALELKPESTAFLDSLGWVLLQARASRSGRRAAGARGELPGPKTPPCSNTWATRA